MNSNTQPVDYPSIRAQLESSPARSAWQRGVKLYALELLADIEAERAPITKEAALNGAASWHEFSYGGCALIYDGDIAERLCAPSELKRVRHGERAPNARESWLDVQARALHQAWSLLRRAAREADRVA